MDATVVTNGHAWEAKNDLKGDGIGDYEPVVIGTLPREEVPQERNSSDLAGSQTGRHREITINAGSWITGVCKKGFINTPKNLGLARAT